jgi:CheY-like chemotaxis protein
MNGGKEVKIFAVTAHAFDSERSQFIDRGCDDCIIKPYQRRDLLTQLNNTSILNSFIKQIPFRLT